MQPRATAAPRRRAMSKCQFQVLDQTGQPLSAPERFWVRTRNRVRFASRRTAKALLHPRQAWTRLRDMLAERGQLPEARAPVRIDPLGLRPGERVRVKSVEEIRETLNDTGRCDGLEYMAWVQDDFCGRAFTVRKRIDRFFDERRRVMLKLRDVVILDEVFCEPDPKGTGPLAGCKKTCFLFWKEAWLERVS